MKFGRTGLAVLGLFAVAAVGCPQPSHKTFNDAGDETGGDGGDGGASPTGGKTGGSTGGSSGSTGGSSGSTGGSSGSTGGSSGSTGGSSGSTGGSSGSTGGSGGATGGSGGATGGATGTGGMGMGGATGASMAGFTTLYDTLIKPKCGPACHITGMNGGLAMPNAMTAYTNLVGKMASNATCKMMRVKPGDPSMSVLSKKVSGTMCGGRMPAGGKPVLTMAEIKMIDDWITGP